MYTILILKIERIEGMHKKALIKLKKIKRKQITKNKYYEIDKITCRHIRFEGAKGKEFKAEDQSKDSR